MESQHIFSFTEIEQKQLIPVIEELQKYELFEISELRKILTPAFSQNNSALKLWKESMLKAIWEFDADTYNNLIRNC